MLTEFRPDFLRKLQQLKIKTRKSFLGSRQGSHLSPRKGHGLEFSDYRLYTPGDDFRHIDWNVYGRADKLYIRQFREEQDLSICFLLDLSPSMFHNFLLQRNRTKFEIAKLLTLAIGHIGLTSGDKICLAPLGAARSPFFNSPNSLAAIDNFLDKLEETKDVDLTKSVLQTSSSLRSPGVCFFISDFLFPAEQAAQAIQILKAKNFEITSIQVLNEDEEGLKLKEGDYHTIDAEDGKRREFKLDAQSISEYQKRFQHHQAGLQQVFDQLEVSHLVCLTNDDTTLVEEFILRELPSLGLLA